MPILKVYKNALFSLFDPLCLDPNFFEIQDGIDSTDRPFTKILLKESPLQFTIRNDPESFHKFDWDFTIFDPGYHLRPAIISNYVDSKKLVVAFADWLNNHVIPYINEHKDIDLWEQIEPQKQFLNGRKISEDDVQPFSEEEKIKVQNSINKFRVLLLREFNPTKEKIDIIDNHLDYLTEAVDRLNKIDWRSIAITTLITITIALTLDTEQGKIVFGLFQQAFSYFIQLLH
jgi:hypothetical protein